MVVGMRRKLLGRLIYFYLIAIMGYGTVANAQELRVYDRADQDPVENVSIFNPTHEKTALTNHAGFAIISHFTEADTLIFQHTSYNTMALSYAELKKLHFRVEMVKRAVKLSEFVVSANKWEESREEVPNKIITINADQIAFNNPQTAADLLSNTGEVFVQKTQQGGGSPMIRGFAANSVLIVIDGVRMNNAIYRAGNLQNVISIDANTIDKAEVIFGPGSVMYGSDALGGVMDFHTRRPDLAYDDKSVTSVSMLARYASANNERTGHLDFNIGTRKWGFLTSLSGSYFDDLRMGSTKHEEYRRPEYVSRTDGRDIIQVNSNPDVQRYSGYDQFNIMQKVRFRPNTTLDFEYGFHYSGSSDIPRYERLIQYDEDSGNLKYADWHYGPQQWMLHTLTAGLMNRNAAYDDARIVLSYQDYKESRHSRKLNNILFLHQEEQVKIAGLNADFQKQFKVKNFFFYGLEAMYNDVSSQADLENIDDHSSIPAVTRYPDGKNHFTSLAAYLSYKRNVNAWVTLLAGARYTYVNLYSSLQDTTYFPLPYDDIRMDNSAVNGSLGLTWRPTTRWQINMSLASGFRAPNLDDVAKIFDSEPGSVVVPNPDLRPEYSYNAELGLIKKFGDHAVIDFAVYYTLLDNAIVRGDFTFLGRDSIWYNGELSRVQAMVNTSSAYIYGVNVSFKWDLSAMFAFTTFLNYTRGEDINGVALRHVTPFFGSSSLVFTHRGFKADLFAVYNGSITYDRLAPSERSKTHIYATDSDGNPYSPSWWTLNLKTSYDINQHFVVDLGFENLLGHRYRTYSSGIVAPGRNIIIALRARF
jgi:hemoglobin/transferrin/lactoferrin receptor protein